MNRVKTIGIVSIFLTLTAAPVWADHNPGHDVVARGGLAQEKLDRQAADAVLQGQIDAEQAARIAADEQLQSNIDAEAAARMAADDAERAARIAADDVETAARLARDDALQADIDAKVDTNAATLCAEGQVLLGGAGGCTELPDEASLQAAIISESQERASADTSLQGQIDAQSLLGKSCPEGLAVLGVSLEGELICGAPWIVDTTPPNGGGNPNLQFSCLNNVSPQELETLVFDSVNATLSGLVLPEFEAQFDILFEAASIKLTFGALFVDEIAVTVAYLDTTENEPCDDAIEIQVVIAQIVLPGSYHIDHSFLGGPVETFVGDFEVDITQLDAKFLANLELPPGINEVNVDTSFDRAVQTPQILETSVGNANVDVFPDGPNPPFFNLIGVEELVVQEAINLIPQAASVVFSGLPAPVTIQVTVVSSP